MLPAHSKIDRFFASYGGKDKKYLCASEVEPVPMKDILTLASDDSRKEWQELTLCLNDPRGHPNLRKEIAQLHDVCPDDVMVAVPQEAIYIAMNTLNENLKSFPEDEFEAVVTFPTYQSLYEDLRTLGVTVKYWTADYTSQGWTFDISKLKSQLTEKTKLLVVNFPNNPTGFVPSSQEWGNIISLCQKKGIFLFSDEMYRLSNNDGSAPLPSVCASYKNSMVLFGMSKTFGMPGLRIGWLCCKDKQLMSEMMQLRDYITGSPAGPCEMLACIALQNKNHFLQRSLKLIKTNLEAVKAFTDRHKDIFEWHAPSSGNTGFMKLKGWPLTLGSGGASGFCKVLRQETGILLLPATIYDYGDEFVRVGFGRAGVKQYLKELGVFLANKKPTD